MTTKKSNYQWAFGKEVRGRNRVSVLIVQGECRRAVASLQSALCQSGLAQLPSVAR